MHQPNDIEDYLEVVNGKDCLKFKRDYASKYFNFYIF